MRCAQEMCGNWSGDGQVCPCELFDIEPEDRPVEPAQDGGQADG